MSGRLIAAVVAAFVILGLGAAAIAQPEPDPSKQCKKGRTTGTGDVPEDENQNGFVCVDSETGAISDDKEQFAPDETPEFGADQNGNNFVCFNPENGVVTDDDLLQEGQGIEDACPPGFILFPRSAVP